MPDELRSPPIKSAPTQRPGDQIFPHPFAGRVANLLDRTTIAPIIPPVDWNPIPYDILLSHALFLPLESMGVAGMPAAGAGKARAEALIGTLTKTNLGNEGTRPIATVHTKRRTIKSRV